jgi:hypothetical protein
MAAKYKIGQKVAIKPARSERSSPRDSSIESYAGQTGEVTNYYWISPHGVETFYLYTVRVGPDYKEIALYEDEIEALIT